MILFNQIAIPVHSSDWLDPILDLKHLENLQDVQVSRIKSVTSWAVVRNTNQSVNEGDYRERRIRRNMLTTNAMQGQERCCQIWADGEIERRITWVGHNVYAACKHLLLNFIQWHLSFIQINIFFLLTSIYSPAVWITKRYFRNIIFLLYFSYKLGNSALLWLETRLGRVPISHALYSF